MTTTTSQSAYLALARRREQLHREARAFALRVRRKAGDGILSDQCAREAELDAEHALSDLRSALELACITSEADAIREGLSAWCGAGDGKGG